MSVTGRFAPQAALGEMRIQLPLYPRKLTRFGNRGMPEKCQQATSNTFRVVPQFSIWYV